MEQPAGVDDLLATSISYDPIPDIDPTSNYESDHEESIDVPEAKVEQHDSPQQNLRDYQLAGDRSRRTVRPPARYAYTNLLYYALVAGMEMRSSEPSCYEEAVSSHDCSKWQHTMDKEMVSLIANNIYGNRSW